VQSKAMPVRSAPDLAMNRAPATTLAALIAFALAIAATLAVPARANELATPHPSIVVDVAAGTIIAGEDVDRRWHPASLTKMMTALTAFRIIARGDATLDSPVKVSARALRQPPSKMSYPVGTVMRLGDALPMLIVKSANDIAVAIAESLSGSVDGFVAEMNREAFRLGLANTIFTNPTGLHDAAQFSSARDLAIIAAEIRRAFPEFAEWFGHDALLVNKTVLPSFNLLIGRFDGADGMKTGFVCASGYNQAASATRDGRTLVAVVLGAGSQSERAEKLAASLNQGFALATGGSTAALAGGVASADPPPDRRAQSCPNGGPPAEDAAMAEPDSPFLAAKAKPVVNPLRIRVGKPDGPVPQAAADFMGRAAPREKQVPVPTPRPDYAPAGGDTLRGAKP
jgi:D-alanyl-D-alanine carboxypeptidase